MTALVVRLPEQLIGAGEREVDLNRIVEEFQVEKLHNVFRWLANFKRGICHLPQIAV